MEVATATGGPVQSHRQGHDSERGTTCPRRPDSPGVEGTESELQAQARPCLISPPLAARWGCWQGERQLRLADLLAEGSPLKEPL